MVSSKWIRGGNVTSSSPQSVEHDSNRINDPREGTVSDTEGKWVFGKFPVKCRTTTCANCS